MSPKITNPELKRSDFVERIRYNARYGMGIGDDQLTNQEAFEATARSLREKLIDGMRFSIGWHIFFRVQQS